jgi:hypothetical protein
MKETIRNLLAKTHSTPSRHSIRMLTYYIIRMSPAEVAQKMEMIINMETIEFHTKF